MAAFAEKSPRRAIIIAFVENPALSLRLRSYAQQAVAAGAMLICADSGGGVALAWGLQPDLLLGDMDSLDPQLLAQLRASGVPIQEYPTAKDETDLELALGAALKQNCRQISIVGGLGGRLDQTLGNLFLLALPNLLQSQVDINIVGEYEEVRLLRGPATLEVEGIPGDLVSLLPATANVEEVFTTNLLYPLRGETLFFGSTRGISNVLSLSPAQITTSAGLLLVIHRFGS